MFCTPSLNFRSPGESLDKLAKRLSIVYFDTTWPGSGVWYIQAEFVPNFGDHTIK
jgi:hypothetical protein